MVPADDTHLSTSVRSASDVAALGPEDRHLLAAWLADQTAERDILPGSRRQRRVVGFIVGGAAVILVPWIGFLSATLPSRYTAHQWRLAWVGFDVALVAALAVAAWSIWRARQLAVAALVVTATLLLCDTWFDLTMSWGSGEQTASIVTAVIGEVPFAIGLLFVGGRLLHSITSYLWHLSGKPGAPPPLFRMPILAGAGSSSARTDEHDAEAP